MKTLNDIVKYVESEIQGTQVGEPSLVTVSMKLNKKTLPIGIAIKLDNSYDGRSLSLTIDSNEHPRMKVRHNGTTYHAPRKSLKIKRKIKYRDTMFSKTIDGYEFATIETFKTDINIDSFLSEAKERFEKVESFKSQRNAAIENAEKFGLGHAFRLLGTYELERIANLIEEGKKEELLAILKDMKLNVPNNLR